MRDKGLLYEAGFLNGIHLTQKAQLLLSFCLAREARDEMHVRGHGVLLFEMRGF